MGDIRYIGSEIGEHIGSEIGELNSDNNEESIPYPKLLVLGNQVPHLRSPSAIQLYRLFADWPPDRLLAVGPNYHPEAERLRCGYVAWPDPYERLERTRLRKVVRSIRHGVGLSAFSGRLENILRRFRPDIVVTLMESHIYYSGAFAFASRRNLPFVLLIHDVPDIFEFDFQPAGAIRKLRDGAIYRGASLRLLVSEEMRLELERRYGPAGGAAMVLPVLSSEIDDLSSARARKRAEGDPFVIGYCGSLGTRYSGLLKDVASELRDLPIQLNVYSFDAPAWCDGRASHYRGALAMRELWATVCKECDALLLPLTADTPHDAQMVRYSFPSKLPEYLRLGLPVIAAVPAYSAVAKWTRRFDGPFLMAEPDAASIVRAASELACSEELCRLFGIRAKRLYNEQFNPAVVRTRFRREMMHMARSRAFRRT